MAKLTLNDITSGYGSNDLINANNAAIEAALENTLSLDGTTPNTMSADLDMGGNAILNLKATSGNENFVWLGDWTTGTSYAVNNLVFVTLLESATYGGSAYICTTAHTAGAGFDADVANWDVFAQQGEDGSPGAGSGDVVGPAGATDGSVALFDGTTGKLIKDSATSVTPTELDYVAGVTSAIQTQMDAKAPLASPTFTGTPSLPTGTTGVTQSAGDNSTKLATTAYTDTAVGAIGGGAWELISSASITAVTNLDTTWDETAYSQIRVVLDGFRPGTNAATLRLRLGHTNGTSFVTSGYFSTVNTAASATSVAGVGHEVVSNAYMVVAWDFNGLTELGFPSGTDAGLLVDVLSSNSTSIPPSVETTVSMLPTGVGAVSTICKAMGGNTGFSGVAVDSLRLYWSTGNWAANGTIYVYGLKNA